MKSNAYGAYAGDKPLEPIAIERRAAGRSRRPDRDPLLRRLPLRPAHGAHRMGRHEVSLRARPRDRRPRHRGRQRLSTASRSATSSASAAWSTAASTATPATRAWSSTARTVSSAPTTARRPMRPAIRSAATRSDIVVDEKFVLQHPPSEAATRRRRAAAVRRHHHLLAAAPLEGRPRARRSASSASAGSATWASSSRTRWARTWSLFTTSPRQAPGRAAPRRRRGRGLEERRGDAAARGQLRLHPQHRRRAARPGRLHRRCSSATARMCLVGAPAASASRARRRQPDLRAPRASPAR